jgi:hypothetical protein
MTGILASLIALTASEMNIRTVSLLVAFAASSASGSDIKENWELHWDHETFGNVAEVRQRKHIPPEPQHSLQNCSGIDDRVSSDADGNHVGLKGLQRS